MARSDGLFVMEIGIDPSKGLNPNDLDELAYVASMVMKTKLDHTHYHHNMPGQGKAFVLKPSQILLVPAVQIEARGWSSKLRAAQFTDADARGAIAVGVPGTAAGIQALVELRQRYIRLEDSMAFRLREHRRTQNNRVRSPLGRLSFVAFGLIAAALIFLVLLPPPHRFGPRDGVSLLLTALCTAMALYFRGRISRWDVPVIRLLRTAHGFFTSADPLNKVIEVVKLDGRSNARVDRFEAMIANIASRLEGEQHRVAMGQNWLALSLVAASLVAAVSALKYADAPSGNKHRDLTPARAAAGPPAKPAALPAKASSLVSVAPSIVPHPPTPAPAPTQTQTQTQTQTSANHP